MDNHSPAIQTKVMQPRNTNLELFRIITILLIVAHHYVVNSTLTVSGGAVLTHSMSPASIFLQLFGAWGKTSINCFVLITGYFMCKSEISIKKFAKLLLEIMFYRLLLYTEFCITGEQTFTAVSFLRILIPVVSIGTGFTGAYLVFYLFIPFLLLGDHELRILLLRDLSACGICAHISVGNHRKTRFWGISALASLIISGISVIACAWLTQKTGKKLLFYFVSDSNTFLAVSTAFTAFMFFKNLKIRCIPFINTVAASCFGVLLIHANSDTMRSWLWVKTLNVTGAYDSPWLALHAVLSVIGIYTVCTVIDQVRIRMIEKPFFRLWDKKASGPAGQ